MSQPEFERFVRDISFPLCVTRGVSGIRLSHFSLCLRKGISEIPLSHFSNWAPGPARGKALGDTGVPVFAAVTTRAHVTLAVRSAGVRRVGRQNGAHFQVTMEVVVKNWPVGPKRGRFAGGAIKRCPFPGPGPGGHGQTFPRKLGTFWASGRVIAKCRLPSPLRNSNSTPTGARMHEIVLGRRRFSPLKI